MGQVPPPQPRRGSSTIIYRSAFLTEWIFRRIGHMLRLIIRDVLHAQEFENLEKCLAVVSKGHRTVVWIALLDEYMTVETAHFRNSEYADAAEGPGFYRQHFPLSDVGAQDTVTVALETVKGDVAGGNITLQSTTGEVRLGILWLQ